MSRIEFLQWVEGKNEVKFKGRNLKHLLLLFENWRKVEVCVFSQFNTQFTEVIVILNCKLLKF